MKKNRMFVNIVLCAGFCACGNAGNMATNIWGRSEYSVETNEIVRLIALAPRMMLSQTNDVRNYVEQVCKTISACPNDQIRYGYFRSFMDSACRVNIESAEGMVPLEKIEEPKVDAPWKPSTRTLEQQARMKRSQKIACVRGGAYGRLKLTAEKIFEYLLVAQPVPAPGIELFEPYFKLIEKFKEEERRVGCKECSFCDHISDQVEFLFNFTHLSVLESAGIKPASRDRAAIETRFKQVVGRPIRSAEQYKADARRRTEANIREQRKQEESKRGGVE